MRDIDKLYSLWLERADADADVKKELSEISGSKDEIVDRFYKSLEFGTAGLRGIIGAGTNRMNIYTVGQATQGLSCFLNDEYENPSVAIAYDSRIKSDLFARHAACVLAANGIKVYLYERLMPTPMLSFAVRRLGCKSGIVITASHNPSKYNGYKCYDPRGYQMTDEAAQKTYEYIEKTDIFDGVRLTDFESALESGLIEYISPEIIDEYYERVLSCALSGEICRQSDLSVIYTPLNGTGNLPVRHVLSKAGIKNVRVVPQQEMPDGLFPTCPYPNPEIRQVFECALEMAESEPADLLLATDPDCDRVGAAVRVGGEYKLISGNEMGVLLTYYLLTRRKELGISSENGVIVKSFVTTELVDRVAESFGVRTVSLLTGFKYIGEYVTGLEQKGMEKSFIAGMEESYGYLVGTHARDKDAVVASLMICEMAAYFKARGMSLYQVMEHIYSEYGSYINALSNFSFEGKSGMEKMQGIMDALRQNAPKQLAGLATEQISDYLSGRIMAPDLSVIGTIDLPRSNVLSFKLENRCSVIIRPSGTEPKIKVYITCCADTMAQAKELADKIGAHMKQYIS